MKDFSKEIINIDGEDYTLFLNRKGVIAWEKYANEENSKLSEISKKYDNILDDNAEITDDTNPFEDIEDIEEDVNTVSNSYKKLYWIMLYENHKFSLSKASELYDKAVEEYGEGQIIALGNQMIEDANIDKFAKDNSELKNLTALRPKKK